MQLITVGSVEYVEIPLSNGTWKSFRNDRHTLDRAYDKRTDMLMELVDLGCGKSKAHTLIKELKRNLQIAYTQATR